jgi:hypothetical protein
MHIFISQPGLVGYMIAYTPDSTVDLVEQEAGSNLWVGLDVDGNFYGLCMWKHTVGRPQLPEGCEQVLNQVRGAIVAARMAQAEQAAPAYERYETGKQIIIKLPNGTIRHFPRTDKGSAAADRYIARLEGK